MSSYPMYSQKPLLATVSQPPVQGIFHGTSAVKLVFALNNSSTQTCFISKDGQIEAMCSWVKVKSLRDLVGKRFGIRVHEELGFVSDIFKEDLSDSFCLYD